MPTLLDLRRMRYFVAVAEELHFRRAAERLRISQPPLSQSIQALERDLGVLLFERLRQRVFLTAAGRLLLERTRQILADVDTTCLDLQAAGEGLGGDVRIGFTASTALMPFLHRAVRRFRTAHPGVRITLTELSSLSQVEGLHKRELDIGILREPPLQQGVGLNFELLCRDRLVLAVHADNPIASRRAVWVSDLRHEPFVSYPRKAGIHLVQKVYELAGASGFYPDIVHQARDSSTIMGLVASGVGVAIVPASLRCIAIDGVRFVALSDAGAGSALHVANRVDDPSYPHAELRRLLVAEAAVAMPSGAMTSRGNAVPRKKGSGRPTAP